MLSFSIVYVLFLAFIMHFLSVLFWDKRRAFNKTIFDEKYLFSSEKKNLFVPEIQIHKPSTWIVWHNFSIFSDTIHA